LQVVSGIVKPIFIEGFDEQGAQLQVEGVFPGLQELMIVDAPFTPVASLIMENLPLFIGGCVRRTPEDTVRMGILGSKIIGDPAIIAKERLPVIIPVDRHGKRVSNVQAIQGPA
jgi:hypothetical protein